MTTSEKACSCDVPTTFAWEGMHPLCAQCHGTPRVPKTLRGGDSYCKSTDCALFSWPTTNATCPRCGEITARVSHAPTAKIQPSGDSNKLGITNVRNERSLFEPPASTLDIEEPVVFVSENKIIEPGWIFTSPIGSNAHARRFHRLRVDVILANGKNFSDDVAPPTGWYARTAANLLAGLYVRPLVGAKHQGPRSLVAAPAPYPAVRGETRYATPLVVPAGQELSIELQYMGTVPVPITFLRVVASGRAMRVPT